MEQHGLVSDTANLDFTTIPFWGDASHLENNWSGTRNKSLASMLSVLAQDPESGIITYGDTTIRHDNKAEVAVEFLDFYKSNDNNDLKYLVFDSKFTTYENLSKLSKDIKFLTIRRRGQKIVKQLDSKPASAWKKVRVPMLDGKGRWLKVIDEKKAKPACFTYVNGTISKNANCVFGKSIFAIYKRYYFMIFVYSIKDFLCKKGTPRAC